MKACICCQVIKELAEFYKHPEMSDGHLNKCKICCKTQAKQRNQIKVADPIWKAAERLRGREKFARLGYGNKYKQKADKQRLYITRYQQKYPEKERARRALSTLVTEAGYCYHHWNYGADFMYDVLKIGKQEHYALHTTLKYDATTFMYKRIDTGELLSTKEMHVQYAASLGIYNLPF